VFFEKQLVAALKILQDGDVSAARMTGSWAGAMGHTQFIPTSYQSFAVDFTGDGRRDICSEDPTDSLASTAA
jgi:membrane-bound lytic murein transglycosylase B